MSYQEDLVQNYADLAESRDWTLEQMADDLEPRDAAMAAELRKRAADEGKGGESKSRGAKPAGRRAPGAKSEG